MGAILNLFTKLGALLNGIGWQATFDRDAIGDRDQEIQNAWHRGVGMSFTAHVMVWLNVLLINRGWAGWKTGLMCLWVSVLALVVCEVVRCNLPRPEKTQ